MSIYIPILSQADLIVDQKKQIVPNGKIDIWDPISSTPVDVFTYDAANDRYVLAVNPIILNVESRPQHTYFVKQLALCRLSRYVGDFYDTLSGSTAASYSFVREWYGAFSEDDAKNDTIISGISSLADANTELGKVTVVGYWTDKDCEARTYVWDPNCVQDPDGGYIIKSNDIDTGRWILMFDGEYLPSTYYGVYPGRESTMNALLNYVTSVGTAQKPTAPGIYFEPGDYTASTVALITSKKVLLDADTSFSRDSFEVADLKVIGDAQHAICDFWIDNPEATAHSSWFNTLAVFYTCGAKKLVFDENNYFSNTNFTHNITLNQKIIEGSTRMPANYGNYALVINNCHIEGQKIWDHTDKIIFQNTDFKDIWFKNPSSIDFNTKVTVNSMNVDTIRLDNFANTTAYVNAMAANGATVLDLAGRDISTLTVPTTVTELRNVIAGTINCSKGSTADVIFRNVKANSFGLSCRYITLYDSDVSFPSEPTFSAMWGNRSRISSSYPWYTKSKQVICEDCWIGIGFNFVTDNNHDTGTLSFTNCVFQTNVSISTKRLTMKRCTTDNNTIKIYPVKIDNVYHIYGTFENCVFNNNSPIEFTKIENDDNCYDCMLHWSFLNNTFAGNTEGIRMRYWQNRTGSNYGKTFVAPVHQDITYQGNVGQCPADSPRGTLINANDTGYVTVTFSEDLKGYKYPAAWKRMVCNRSSSTASFMNTYMEQGINDAGTLVKYYSWVNSPYDSLSYDLFIQSTWFMYPKSIDEQVQNGDWFAHAIICMGDYLRIVQRGDGDHNRGIIGKVI